MADKCLFTAGNAIIRELIYAACLSPETAIPFSVISRYTVAPKVTIIQEPVVCNTTAPGSAQAITQTRSFSLKGPKIR